LDREKQKENRITLLQEPKRRIYIQIKGKLRDEQIAKIWMKLEKDLYLTTKVKEGTVSLPTREDIIYQIIELIKLKGYTIDYEDAQSFLENFQLKYDRLPKNDEITSIVKGYVIMINEDYFSEQIEAFVQPEPLSTSIATIIGGGGREFSAESSNKDALIPENPIGRRRCPSCGDESSIREVIDKNIVLMDYPRIYGKKKYCCKCGYDWR
jgi:hypothetical protein